MASLKLILSGMVSALESDTLLDTFAKTLKKDEPGSAGRLVVLKGNEFLAREIPLENYPFTMFVIGDEIGQDYDAPGRSVRRQCDVHFAFFDNNTSRGTDRAIDFEENMVRVLGRFLSMSVVGPNNPDGLIRDFDVGLILVDRDVNRPKVFRTLPVELEYTTG